MGSTLVAEMALRHLAEPDILRAARHAPVRPAGRDRVGRRGPAALRRLRALPRPGVYLSPHGNCAQAHRARLELQRARPPRAGRGRLRMQTQSRPLLDRPSAWPTCKRVVDQRCSGRSPRPDAIYQIRITPAPLRHGCARRGDKVLPWLGHARCDVRPPLHRGYGLLPGVLAGSSIPSRSSCTCLATTSQAFLDASSRRLHRHGV
jgi:hypothetical protein